MMIKVQIRLDHDDENQIDQDGDDWIDHNLTFITMIDSIYTIMVQS